MPGLGHALAPEQSRELLSALSRAEPESSTDRRRFVEVKRDIVAALRAGTVLVAGEHGRPAGRPAGPQDGAVLPVFTDDEAAEAWAAAQHPAAPPVEVLLSTELDGGRSDWRTLAERERMSALVVNPAGPFGCVVYARELGQLRPRLLRRGGRGEAQDVPWLDLAARAAERARVEGLLSELETALAAGAPGDSPPAPDRVNRFGSLDWSARMHLLRGRRRVLEGDRDGGLQEIGVSSAQWRLAGDPYRATDALLGAVPELVELAERAGGEDHDGARRRLRLAVGSLVRLSVTGYRAQEIGALQARLGEDG